MKKFRYSTWLLHMLLGGLLALPAIAEEDAKPVMISGELKSFSMTHNGETVEHPETRGTVPAEFTFEGDTLEGTVKLLSDDERLEVDIVKGSNRSRSSTQGKGGTLTVVVR